MGAESSELDPFERFNRAQGQGTVRSPYPRLAAWRREAPVRRLSADDLDPSVRLQGRMLFGEALPPVFQVLSHDAVAEVLRDGERFSSAGYARTVGLVFGHSILEMDGREHTRSRGVIQQAFSRRALERWEQELVRPIVASYVDRFAARGRADLVRELTFPFPVAVIAQMMGLAAGDHADFHRWAVELISLGIDPQRGFAASVALKALFARVLAERRAEPRGDLISVLAGAELDGVRLDDDAIFAFLLLLAPAGAETTYRSSSNLLFGLLSNPDQLEAVRKDRSLLPRAIEEGLRWESPLIGIQRTATRDTEVAGVPIPAGALVLVNLASANHDETRYARPEAFDLFRPAKAHMAFAFGPHLCLGMHLARLETRVALETLFDRLPGLRLDPEAVDTHITGALFRSPLALPVVWNPA
jgi:cytochrome P450